MFKDDFEAAAGAAAAKSSFLKRNPMGYIVLSILAGMYIGFGILLSFTVGGLMAGAPAAGMPPTATVVAERHPVEMGACCRVACGNGRIRAFHWK